MFVIESLAGWLTSTPAVIFFAVMFVVSFIRFLAGDSENVPETVAYLLGSAMILTAAVLGPEAMRHYLTFVSVALTCTAAAVAVRTSALVVLDRRHVRSDW